MTRSWVDGAEGCKSPSSERLHHQHGHLTHLHAPDRPDEDSTCCASSPAWHHQPVHQRHPPLTYESLYALEDAKASVHAAHAPRGVIYLSRASSGCGTGPPSPRLVARWTPRKLAFALASLALLVLLMAKIFHLGSTLFSNPAFRQELAGIGVLRRSRQQHAAQRSAASDADLYMELAPQLHATRQQQPSMAGHAATPATLRIPRIIHQIYHGRVVFSDGQAYISRRRQPFAAHDPVASSWQHHNGQEWQHRFYDDEACMAFVQTEFPQYLEAYQQLPYQAERHDFFRYLVVLKYGGVYADVGVECAAPLDAVLRPGDSLVAGWEAEVATDEAALSHGMVRRRQLLQWWFAAVPGHPALKEVCDRVAAAVGQVLSMDPHRDALERTGPGVWTDVILRYAQRPPSSSSGNLWPVRILPRAAFGLARPQPAPRSLSSTPQSIPAAAAATGMAVAPLPTPVAVQHPSSDSSMNWRECRNLACMQRWLGRKVTSFVQPGDTFALSRSHTRGASSSSASSWEPLHQPGVSHFPVSAAFEPPFVIMVDAVGQGDTQAGVDVSAVLTDWGTWQAGASAPRQPSAVEALVGALAASTTAHAGAGSTGVGSIEASGESNDSSSGGGSGSHGGSGSGGRSHSTQGSTGQTNSEGASRDDSDDGGSGKAGGSIDSGSSVAFVDVGAGVGFFSLAAAARGYRVVAFEASPRSVAAFRASIAYNAFERLIDIHEVPLGAAEETVCLRRSGDAGAHDAADVALRRGYGNPAVHGAEPWACDQLAQRATLGKRLSGVRAGALRLSAGGWEGWVVQGGEAWLRKHPPGVVLLEYAPALMKKAGYGRPQDLLRLMAGMGYGRVAHAGRVCERRWANLTHAMQGRAAAAAHQARRLPRPAQAGRSRTLAGNAGGGGAARAAAGAGQAASAHQPPPHQPAWCKLQPESFHLLEDALGAEVGAGGVESVLLIHDSHPSARDAAVTAAANAGERSATAASTAHATVAAVSGAASSSSSSSDTGAAAAGAKAADAAVGDAAAGADGAAGAASPASSSKSSEQLPIATGASNGSPQAMSNGGADGSLDAVP